MTRRNKTKAAVTVKAAADISAQASHQASGLGKLGLVVFILCVLAGGIAAGLMYFEPLQAWAPQDAKSPNPGPAPVLAAKDYVGADACASCHEDEFKAWKGSHHDLAMQAANAQTVLADFNNTSFQYNGIESTFFKRDAGFFVRTDGPDGKLTEYPIKYTFGVTPLQQYLIEFPGGRLQALGIAWDSRPPSEGGQRWFHVSADEKLDYTDQLHWTGRYQNWNLQCAECHSTQLKKAYDAATDTYNTHFKALNVACEACHGLASQHVEWAQKTRQPYAADDDKGLAVRLNSRWQAAWSFPAKDAAFAHRDQAADDTLMNACWACHARRATLVEGAQPGLPLEDTHRPALLTQPAYHADGQQRDEDYTWGSFRQSKMFQKGVTCMDCHEPHALRLRAEGNALCARCHNPAIFDSQKHHFHTAESKGGQCMDCHAPEQRYMGVDGRHDHSFRLPRPDLSLELGSPNACTQCHQDRRPEWAAAALDRWYGKAWRDRPHYGRVLHAGATAGGKALPSLLQLAQDTGSPAIVRATALSLLSPLMRPELLVMARTQLKDPDPSVRIAALGLIEPLDAINRVLSASPLLGDPVLGVRIEAARILADVPEDRLPAARRGAFRAALQQYIQILRQDADWPAANVNLGNLFERQDRLDAAMEAYQRALTLDPKFAGAYVNLADVYRRQGDEDKAEQQLRKGLSVLPDAADLHHALGLLLVRKAHMPEALKALRRAAELAPDNARYGYVYGVALHSAGKMPEAIAALQAIDERSPYDFDILDALVSMQRQAGDFKSALKYARKAAEILPEDVNLQRLIQELEAAK